MSGPKGITLSSSVIAVNACIKSTWQPTLNETKPGIRQSWEFFINKMEKEKVDEKNTESSNDVKGNKGTKKGDFHSQEENNNNISNPKEKSEKEEKEQKDQKVEYKNNTDNSVLPS